MGMKDGFLKYNRELPGTRTPAERTSDYKEIYTDFPEEKTVLQAARCMDCGVPFCHNGCPLGNNIPEFNDAVYNEDWELAINVLLDTNNFPEFTGRICPAPCEGSCVLGIHKPQVTIEHIEKTIAEKAYELGHMTPRPPETRTDSRVAVIGSGPAGLTAADQLNKAGHQVTVFERSNRLGGLLTYGIPDFKLEKWVVERRTRVMEDEGVIFKTGVNIGVDIMSNDILSEFDAVILCGGSTIPRDLPIPGRELKGVHYAMDFLTQQNKRVAGESFGEEEIIAKGKDVIVIGGGDTGSDCVGTSNRQGAKSITQLELLPRPPEGREEENPWPEWPMILRTSSSHEEGCERKWAVMSEKFEADSQGNLKSLKLVEIEWFKNKEGKSGFKKIEGSEKVLPCDLVFLAMGFVHPQRTGMLEQLGVQVDERGNVKADNYKTNIDKVFAAGDMRRGQSLVVWAISEGREAAREVDMYLTGKEANLKSKSRAVTITN